jgi:hypothetical protein
MNRDVDWSERGRTGMDYTISNNAKLFDELLQVLNNHQNEPGVVEALDDLKAAKVNYVQRSIDHMMNCLVLAIHDLVVHPPSAELRTDLSAVIDRYYAGMFQAGSRLGEMAREYEASGGKLLSHDEILEEVDERRGVSR